MAAPAHHNPLHIAYLDTIRGFAALAVVSDHFIIAYGLPCQGYWCEQWLDYSPLHFWWDGAAAVSLFFVLSGLVLSLKYFHSDHQPDMTHFNLYSFTVSRLLRIWAPYCVIWLLSAVLYKAFTAATPVTTLLTPSDWIAGMWRNHPLDGRSMLREVLLPYMPDIIVLIPQAWTLTLELLLSLLLPIGLLLSERGTSWLLFFALLAVGLLGISVYLLHFLLGLLIARHHTQLAAYVKQRLARPWLLPLLALLLLTSSNTLYLLLNNTGLKLATGLGAGLLLIAVISSTRIQNLLSRQALRRIGKVSYSIYLLHMALLICVTPYWLGMLEKLTDNRFQLWLGGWLGTMGLTLACALLSYRWLETPCMAAGRSLSSRLTTKR